MQNRTGSACPVNSYLNSVETIDFLKACRYAARTELLLSGFTVGKIGNQITPMSAKSATILLFSWWIIQNGRIASKLAFLLMAKFLRKEFPTDLRDLFYRTRFATPAARIAPVGGRWL